jgi:hypothetical protein
MANSSPVCAVKADKSFVPKLDFLTIVVEPNSGKFFNTLACVLFKLPNPR